MHRSPLPQDLPVAAADIVPPRSITPQSDGFIWSDVANQNYGTHDSLLIQKAGIKGAARILVAFPQSGIADSLGADSLVSASLELTINRTGTDWGTTGRAVALHRLTRAWAEAGATWNCANDLNLGNLKADCTGNTWIMAGATLPFATPAAALSVITNGHRCGELRRHDGVHPGLATRSKPSSRTTGELRARGEVRTVTGINGCLLRTRSCPLGGCSARVPALLPDHRHPGPAE